MLKMTQIKHELITDSDMYIFFGKSTRGGIYYISNSYRKANNRCLKCYDPKYESKHIIYLGANNLYGYTMSKFFPRNGFKWVDPKVSDLKKYINNSSNIQMSYTNYIIT